jgi:hypothetical protein
VPSGGSEAVANDLEKECMLEPHGNFTRAVDRESSVRYIGEARNSKRESNNFNNSNFADFE